MVQPPMGFLDVQSHPLMFRRSQSREALENQQKQGVSTFQIHNKRVTTNEEDLGGAGHYQQIGQHQNVLPMMEVRTLGRPQTKKRGQNFAHLSTPKVFDQEDKHHAEV